MALRYLSKAEIAFARPVFRDSVPWSRIQLADDLGMGDIEYTWQRTVHVGRTHYAGMDASPGGRSLLIHELTHVWQHEHGVHGSAYIAGSVAAQLLHGRDIAYRYFAGRTWDDYNPEQQAMIVQDWYFKGQSTTSPLFRYIRDHIWKKTIAPDHRVEFPSAF